MLVKFLTILCLVFNNAATLVAAINLYRNRAEALALFTGKEDRLYFGMCFQSSNRETCTYAMDSSVTQEASQCARTDYETQPFWVGILENPSYITKVTILNSDPALQTLPDGLARFSADVDKDECISYASAVPFNRRTFGCDKVGVTFGISSTRDGRSVLSVCDIEVMGVPLKFLDLAGTETQLPIIGCSDAAGIAGCQLAIDNLTSTCVDASAATDAKAVKADTLTHALIFTLNLSAPSIINEIHVSTDSPEDISAHIGTTVCQQSKEISGGLLKLFCSAFGNTVEIRRANKKLQVCHVQALGYESDAREPTRYAYMGCHSENPADRDLPQLVSATRLTVDKCYRVCKRYGFKFFGLHSYRFCYCGFTFGKHGKLESNFGCEKPCDGDGKLQCGSEITISIYEILS